LALALGPAAPHLINLKPSGISQHISVRVGGHARSGLMNAAAQPQDSEEQLSQKSKSHVRVFCLRLYSKLWSG
jgi:hypothetical protein